MAKDSLCPDALLVDRVEVAEFVDAIRAALVKKYEDHADLVLDAGAVQRLIDVLAVV